MLKPDQPTSTDPDGRVAERLGALERELRQIHSWLSGGSTQQVPVVTALPAAGRKGRLVVLNSDGHLYVDSGAAWISQT